MTTVHVPTGPALVTFREAITAANNTAGPNTIAFNIPLDNAELIGDSLRMELEGSPWRLTDNGTTIDGTTQVEFNGRSLFFMTTPPLASLNGITVDSDNNVLTSTAHPATSSSGGQHRTPPT